MQVQYVSQMLALPVMCLGLIWGLDQGVCAVCVCVPACCHISSLLCLCTSLPLRPSFVMWHVS